MTRISARSPQRRFVVEQLEDRLVPAGATPGQPVPPNDVPAMTSLHAELVGFGGNTVQLSGTFSDADTDDPHAVLVNWGDGSPIQYQLAVGDRAFQFQHMYTNGQAAQQAPLIQVTLSDQVFAGQVAGSVGAFDAGAFRNPQSVLGEPTRFTDPSGQFGGAVTPFNAPFGANEIVTLQDGESITVRFSVPVRDNPSSEHFGADFLVFGNSFYHIDFNTMRATGGVFEEPGQIEVSQDGITFFPISSSFADTKFPTNGYRNPTGPFDLPPANALPSDFGLPVNLSFNEVGLTLNEIVAAYNGSGGGAPVDISGTGLPWIQYVRIHGATGGVEVDALSIVNPLPAPVTVGNFHVSAADLDSALGLYVDYRGFFQGSFGSSAKWLRGEKNAFGNPWYFLRNTGEFVAWNGLGTSGAVLEHFDPQVYMNPKLLYEASQAFLPGGQPAQAQQLDSILGLYVDARGFFEGGSGDNTKWLRGQNNAFGNPWYFLHNDGEFGAWNGLGDGGTLLGQFDPQLFRDPQLLYEAFDVPLSGNDFTKAQQLDASLGLYVDAAGFYEGGAGIKWLRGQTNAFGNPWYILRNTGAFLAWNGLGGGTGTLLHQFNPQIFLDPDDLFEAAQATLSAADAVQVQQYRATLGLYVDAAGLYQGAFGSSAKWLRGQTNAFGNPWYLLRDTGEFIAWNGSASASGNLLYTFNPSVFLNPDVLL